VENPFNMFNHGNVVQIDPFLGSPGMIGDSGEAERLFRREVERHSGMIPNTIGA
jgi:hypothetical protein